MKGECFKVLPFFFLFCAKFNLCVTIPPRQLSLMTLPQETE